MDPNTPVCMIFLDENFIVKGYNEYLIQELGFCDIDPNTIIGTNINEHIPEFVTSMKGKKSYIKIDNRVLQGLFSFYKFTIIIEVSIYSKSFIDFLVNQLKIPCTTSLDVIKRLQNSRLTETQKNYVEIIRKNKILISQTIINMIDYIKAVSRAHVLDTPNEFFLSSAINDIINFTKFNDNINVKYSIQNDVVLYTDYKKFIDMLMHIIKNCTKNRKGTINIISKSNKDILSISIHDKNPKLSTKNRANIFSGFMNTEYVKTDLSLPIAKSFARLLGGDLILENSAEEGNIYKFYTSLDDINM